MKKIEPKAKRPMFFKLEELEPNVIYVCGLSNRRVLVTEKTTIDNIVEIEGLVFNAITGGYDEFQPVDYQLYNMQ